MNKLLLLDLFCGAGGAARGYQRAGFYVVGVDIRPQPHYAGLNRQRDQLAHYGIDARWQVMEIDWTNGNELSQSIPPAYTEFIGRALMNVLPNERKESM